MRKWYIRVIDWTMPEHKGSILTVVYDETEATLMVGKLAQLGINSYATRE